MTEEFLQFISEVRGVPYTRSIRGADDGNQGETWDDAVTLGIKVLCARWSLCILLWTLSYLLVMFQVISDGSLIPWTIFIFLPMWTGSIFAIFAVIIVLTSTCNNTRLITPEQRHFLRTRGDVDQADYIDYDSMPLLRRLFFWGIMSALFAIMAVITQVRNHFTNHFRFLKSSFLVLC